MHEMSMIAELVDVCLAHAARGADPVVAVRVRHASTIPDDVLRQGFAMFTDKTPLQGVLLEVEKVDTVLDCPRCDFNGPLEHDDLVQSLAVCPDCGEPSPAPSGPELELLGLRHESVTGEATPDGRGPGPRRNPR